MSLFDRAKPEFGVGDARTERDHVQAVFGRGVDDVVARAAVERVIVGPVARRCHPTAYRLGRRHRPIVGSTGVDRDGMSVAASSMPVCAAIEQRPALPRPGSGKATACQAQDTLRSVYGPIPGDNAYTEAPPQARIQAISGQSVSKTSVGDSPPSWTSTKYQ